MFYSYCYAVADRKKSTDQKQHRETIIDEIKLNLKEPVFRDI